MTIYDSESVDLQAFLPGRFYFPPTDIYTEAVFVTRENVGALAIVFEQSLCYDVHGDPYFRFMAQRGTDESPADPQDVVVFPGSWIFVIRQELHVYKDVDFRNTFREIDLTNLLPEAQTDQQNVFWTESPPARYIDVSGLPPQQMVFNIGDAVRVKSSGVVTNVADVRAQQVRGRNVWVYGIELIGHTTLQWFEAEELEKVDTSTDT